MAGGTSILMNMLLNERHGSRRSCGTGGQEGLQGSQDPLSCPHEPRGSPNLGGQELLRMQLQISVASGSHRVHHHTAVDTNQSKQKAINTNLTNVCLSPQQVCDYLL